MGFWTLSSGPYPRHFRSRRGDDDRPGPAAAPRIVLLDDDLPEMGGVEGLQKLAAESPDSEVVVLAGRFDRGSGVRAILEGAAGYISRRTAPDALPRVVRGVMRGEAAIPRTLAMAMIDRLRLAARSEAGTRPTGASPPAPAVSMKGADDASRSLRMAARRPASRRVGLRQG